MKTLFERPISESARRRLPDDIHPVLKRVYAARNIAGKDDLDNSLTRLHSPAALKGLSQAIDVLVAALQKQERILVVGDGSWGTTLADLITLTPGTLSMDVSTDRKVLYVHVADCEDVGRARREIKQGFERRVREVYR